MKITQKLWVTDGAKEQNDTRGVGTSEQENPRAGGFTSHKNYWFFEPTPRISQNLPNMTLGNHGIQSHFCTSINKHDMLKGPKVDRKVPKWTNCLSCWKNTDSPNKNSFLRPFVRWWWLYRYSSASSKNTGLNEACLTPSDKKVLCWKCLS
jgi:hypothetical protein